MYLLLYATGGRPHVLVLNDSSNHLDSETLDSLAAAMESFQGGCHGVPQSRDS
jgi:ATPase subunit of ABC transporter with duplicated ATPase domains